MKMLNFRIKREMVNMKSCRRFAYILCLSLLTGCLGNMNPTGGNSTPHYPYFITTEPVIVKKILVPVGTKLTYEEDFFREGQQDKILNEKKLTDIDFPAGKTINWGGVPIKSISKFFNSEMRGFSVYADFTQLNNEKQSNFSKLWQSCSDKIGIEIKNSEDWSFNKKNISDIKSCSVLYQRYFKEDVGQQTFLDNMYKELMKVNSN
jgi:hypothetical protein